MSQQINLFNPLFAKSKQIFTTATLVKSFALLLFGYLGIFLFAFYQVRNLDVQAKKQHLDLQSAQLQVAKLRAEATVPVKNKQLEVTLKGLESELQKKQKILSVLEAGNLGSRAGYAQFLSAFARQIPDGLWLTGFDISQNGSDINLRGRTLRPELVPLYVSQLKREKVMEGRSFSALEIHRPLASPEMKMIKDSGVLLNEKLSHSIPASPVFLEFELRSNTALPTATEGERK